MASCWYSSSSFWASWSQQEQPQTSPQQRVPRGDGPGIRFAHLSITPPTAMRRVMGRHPHHKGHKMPPVVVFIGEQRFKHVKRIGKPTRQIQVRTVAPVQGWTQAMNELPGHLTTKVVAGSHDPCAGTVRACAVPLMGNPAGFRLVEDDVNPQGLAVWEPHKGRRGRRWSSDWARQDGEE